MRTVSLVLSIVGVALIGACTASVEDSAYALAKKSAASDLPCDDISVKKVGQLEEAFGYRASGCGDVYSYAVACDGGCRVVAGYRGDGPDRFWAVQNSIIDLAGTIVDTVTEDIRERRESAKASHARIEAVREQIRRDQEARSRP